MFGAILDINFLASCIVVYVLVLGAKTRALLELNRTGLWGLTSYLLFVGWLARQPDREEKLPPPTWSVKS